jgi:RNA polymerase sigma-70 factor (ECF subfamily)
MSLVGDPDVADDLVQDCLERAIRKRHQWRRDSRISTWLYRILYHLFLDRAVSRRKELERAESLRLSLRSTEPALQEDHVACSDIVQAMQRLPVDQRAAIGLTVVEGLSYEEAADVLRIPIGTFRSRLARGRDRLRSLYAPHREHRNLKSVN